jgi:hypothetical protein
MVTKSIEISVKGKWIEVPALEVDGGHSIIVKGGWTKLAIVDAEEWREREIEDPDACVTALKGNSTGLHADIFTFAQKIPGSAPKYKYPMEWDSIAAIHLESFKSWWEKLPQESRKNVRRSEKRGVTVIVKELDDELIRGIVDVNNDSTVRQGRHFVHYGKTFDQVKKDQSTFLDRSSFICAYLGDELIGFMKIVYQGEVASILQILPKASHQDKRPTNAMLAKTVELCEQRGVAYLVYGQFNYGNKRGESSLREFKTRNGFTEMLTPRYYIPLTMWGSLSLKLNCHHGVRGMLPTGMLEIAVKARAKWYDLKQSTGRCSSMPERSTCNRQMECSNPPAGSNT